MFLPWCCGTGKEGLFRWRRAPERRPEMCLADCLEQLSSLLSVPQIFGDDGPQVFHMLEELHRLLHDVHIQVEKALSQRSAEGGGGSVGSRCRGSPYKSEIGDVSSARDGVSRCCSQMESFCIRCAQVPAALCISCAQDACSVVGALPALSALGRGRVHTGCPNGLSSGMDLRARAPRSSDDQRSVHVQQATGSSASTTRQPAPQQFYIGDDEAWRCDDPKENVPPVAGGAWRSEPGLPKQLPAPSRLPVKSSSHAMSAWEKQARSRAYELEAWDEESPRERANSVLQMRRQLNGLSEHSRHLLTVPVSTQASERASSSTGGTFRELFTACTSEDMVLVPPSCLQASAPSGGKSVIEGGGVMAPVVVGGVKGAVCHTKVRDTSDISAVLRHLPPPPQFFDDDEDCDCEKYAVSRQKDGRLVWAPEPLELEPLRAG